MNRSALKLPCAVLFGVAVGWGIRGLPSWNGGARGTEGRPAVEGAQSGAGTDYRSGPTGSANEAGATPTGGKPGRARLEMLAARFRNKTEVEDETVMAIDVVVQTGGMSVEEFGPLITLLAEEGADEQALGLLAVRWGMLDPKAALAFAMGKEELAGSSDVIPSIMNELAKVDLSAAKAALTQLESQMRTDVGIAIVRMLQQKDIRAALSCARDLGNDWAEADVLRKWSESDPLAAVAEFVPGNNGHQRVAGQIARSLAAKDRAAFEAWVENLVDPSLRAAARCEVLNMDASQNPEDAARSAAAWLAREPEGSPQASLMAQNVARRWMETKAPPAEVAAWAARLPEGPARDSAVRETVSQWLEQDTMAVSSWLRSLPQSAERDDAVYNLVQKIGTETPADAFEWARTIGKLSLRHSTLAETLQIWAGQNLAAAQQAVAAMPDGDRIYLQEVLEEQATERK